MDLAIKHMIIYFTELKDLVHTGNGIMKVAYWDGIDTMIQNEPMMKDHSRA